MATNIGTLRFLKQLKRKIETFQDGMPELMKMLSYHIGQQERQKSSNPDWRAKRKRK